VRGKTRGVQQAPEEVRRVRVWMAECGRLDARVQAHKEAQEVGRDSIGKGWEVRVSAWRGVSF
jgi:hypothetical protein